ncbi:MAG TPA: N-acetyltransferase [Acidobacteriota bacterium]|nr:N-acetyltransferase [Acidobacteriota bacterium]
MPDLKYLPISHLDSAALKPLMDEEEREWLSELGWDYSPIRRILDSFIQQKLLPGYVAVDEENKAAGYTYFLVNQAKGIIGTLYAPSQRYAQEMVEELISLTIACLKDSPKIKRIEAQIMPFNDLNLTAAFTQRGFACYRRYYMETDLNVSRLKSPPPFPGTILPLNPEYLPHAAKMTFLSYRNQTDAEICEDYRSITGCEKYLRSLVENPGCGVFMPESSFMALDENGAILGYVISCRISGEAGMIPQIAIHPSYQGHGLGNSLMEHALRSFGNAHFQSVSLTVTKKNRRAFDWYQRLGFRIRKEFGAYVWQR